MAIFHPLNYYPYTSLRFDPLLSIASISGAVLLILLSNFSIKSNRTQSVLSTIQISPAISTLSHRRLVADLSIFYRCFHGHCSLEIRNTIPGPVRRVGTTRSSTQSHLFQVTLPIPRTLLCLQGSVHLNSLLVLQNFTTARKSGNIILPYCVHSEMHCNTTMQTGRLRNHMFLVVFSYYLVK